VNKKPLPQRYIDRKDWHTLKTIEIIGRKKYEELLDAGIIAVSYEIKVDNNKRRSQHLKKLNNTIETLSTRVCQSDCPHRLGYPIHQNQ